MHGIYTAEGIDESSRQEFDVLVQNDLLVGELVVIHGTGLTETEFNARCCWGRFGLVANL